MLDNNDIDEINELIKQGKTNYKIGKELEYSPNTIKKIREEFLKAGESQVHEEEVDSDSPIDFLRSTIGGIEKVIKTCQLKEKEKKELEKLLENLKKILKSEVDDRIVSERANTVEKRDQEWNKYIEQQYVKKEVAADFENKIKENNIIIENLRNEIKKKDDIIVINQSEFLKILGFNQDDNDLLKIQMQYHINEKNNLIEENQSLYNYICYRLDNDVRFGQEELKYNIQIFNDQKTNFLKYQKEQLTNLKDLFLNMEEKKKGIIIREEKLANLEREIYRFLEEVNKETEIRIKILQEQRIEGERLQK